MNLKSSLPIVVEITKLKASLIFGLPLSPSHLEIFECQMFIDIEFTAQTSDLRHVQPTVSRYYLTEK